MSLSLSAKWNRLECSKKIRPLMKNSSKKDEILFQNNIILLRHPLTPIPLIFFKKSSTLS